MSDSSEDEDLSRFREAVDPSFVRLIDESRGNITKNVNKKSERYLETSSHYNDVRVPDDLQKQIGAKISAIINKNIEFITLDHKIQKRKIKGGVKLFKDSDGFLSCEEVKDTYTENHNRESKKLKNKKRQCDSDTEIQEIDKAKSVAVTGEYVMSKEDTKYWKSRQKEKLFKYKSNGKSKALLAIE